MDEEIWGRWRNCFGTWIRDSPIPFETNEESRRHVGNRELNRIEGSFFEINWIYSKWNQELERIDLLEFHFFHEKRREKSVKEFYRLPFSFPFLSFFSLLRYFREYCLYRIY